jgi:hypothetical protein
MNAAFSGSRRRAKDTGYGYGLTLVGRKRATRATTFDHVEIEIGFPLFPHDADENKNAAFSAIPALRFLIGRLPDLDCHFASAVCLAFLTFLTRLTSDTSQPLFDQKNQRLTAPQIWLSACLWFTRGQKAMLNDSGPHERWGTMPDRVLNNVGKNSPANV